MSGLAALLSWLGARSAGRSRRHAEKAKTDALETLAATQKRLLELNERTRTEDVRRRDEEEQRNAEDEAADFYCWADWDHKSPCLVRFQVKKGAPVRRACVLVISPSGVQHAALFAGKLVLKELESTDAAWPSEKLPAPNKDAWRGFTGELQWESGGHLFTSPLRFFPHSEQGRIFDSDMRVRRCLGRVSAGS